jgi:N-acetylglucosaminyl-diphospho-decaprenol L-rhamnosyltransferase
MSDSVIRLTLHGVGELPTRPLEPGEEKVWLTLRQFELLADSVAGRSDVFLTFDDGNASDLEVALPLLLERGLTAEFFLCGGLLGEPGRLTIDGVQELLAAGMTVGSHGWRHLNWRELQDTRISQELERSAHLLRRITGQPIEHVSVPYGSYDRRVLARVKRLGYSRVYTSDGGRSAPNAWLQDRISLHSDMDQAWLTGLLDHAPTPRQRARAFAARSAKRSRGLPELARRSSPPTAAQAPQPGAAATRDAARVGVVIVTYNSADVLVGALESLPAGAEGVELVDVVVVDNASTDDSVSIAEGFGAAPTRAIKTGVNGGYAAGVNAGLDALDLDQLDAVLILNPDCALVPGSLALLADKLTTVGCGIVAPKLINSDGSLQPSLRLAPSLRRSLAESVLGSAAGRLGLGELATEADYYDKAAKWPWATGAAMLLSTVMIKELGPWDESFLLYSEETDYALRAADAGWDLWYEPAAVFWHHGGDAHMSAMGASLVVNNRVQLYRRRHTFAAGVAYYLVEVAGAGVRALAGRPEAKAAVVALVRPSRRIRRLPT